MKKTTFTCPKMDAVDSEEKPKTAVKTYCRIRPRFEGWEDKVTLKYTHEKVINNAKKQSTRQSVRTTRFFTDVFGPTANNLDIFNSMVVPMLENVMNGFPSVLIAYGQTGSGKTYTMLGVGSNQQAGILQYSLEWLLEKSESNSIDLTAVEVYGIHATKLEFYDLFMQPDEWASKVPLRALHQATTLRLETPKECNNIVLKAHRASHFAPTARNPQSSRGHAAFICRVKSKGRESAFVVVDLAGSEGMDALQSSKLKKQVISYETRKMEAGTIKNGLGELRGMINELKRGKLQKNLGSGLRQLLVEHVTGNTILSFIFTLAPSKQHAVPTENTLRVADCASQIKKQVTRITKAGPTAKEIINKLQKELKEKDRHLDECRKETSAAVLQNQQLESERSQFLDQLAELFSLRERVRQLESEKIAWETRESELEATERESRRNIADLMAQLEVMSRKTGIVPGGGVSLAVENLRAQNDELRQRLEDASQTALNRGGIVKEQKVKLGSLRGKLIKMETRYSSDMATLRTENAQLKKRVDDLEGEVHFKDLRINALERQLELSKGEDSEKHENPSDSESEVDFPTIPLSACIAINTSIEEAMKGSEQQMKQFLETAWDKICGADDYKTAVLELFEKIDTENDGVIDMCEFTAIVTKYGWIKDQEAINDVFNKICSRMENRQKVMELADLENLIFVEGNKYWDQPLEVIFGKAVLSKLNQPLLNFEDDLIEDWLDYRSASEWRWLSTEWGTCWVEVDRKRREIRVWKDNFKRELTQRISLNSSKVSVNKGGRDTATSDREDSKQFHVMIAGRIYDSVYHFRAYSNVMRDAWGQFIRSLVIDDDVEAPTIMTEITLILGLQGNGESTRILRFSSANPLVSEVLIKLKKIMEVDGYSVQKFGLHGDLSEVKLLCRGRTLKPIETLKDGDVVYAQTSPMTYPSMRKLTQSPRTTKIQSQELLPRLSESDFLAQLRKGDDNSVTKQHISSLPSLTLPRTSRVSLFNVRSWRSSAEPSMK